MATDEKIEEILVIAKVEEILTIVKEERKLNNSRFVQLSATLQDFKQETNGRMDKLEGDIHKVYTVLTEDNQAFAEDLSKVNRRVDKIEHKMA